ncbi:MAG: SseB family protein [Parasulfuritortus sp.]|nr:SseB family protein [Parasulfuritortus sp.]
MDNTPFVPRNDLEQLLLDMLSMEVDPEDFANRILDMQVFMPIKDEKHQIAGFQLSTKADPMVLEDDEGHRAVIVFTAPERAKDFVALYPDYNGGLLTEFSWILSRMGENLSIALNPGLDEGFDFDPHMVAMMVTLLNEKAQ